MCVLLFILQLISVRSTYCISIMFVVLTYGKAVRKRGVLSWALKDDKDEDVQIFSGSEFQTAGAWYWKDRAPALFRLTRERACNPPPTKTQESVRNKTVNKEPCHQRDCKMCNKSQRRITRMYVCVYSWPSYSRWRERERDRSLLTHA